MAYSQSDDMAPVPEPFDLPEESSSPRGLSLDKREDETRISGWRDEPLASTYDEEDDPLFCTNDDCNDWSHDDASFNFASIDTNNSDSNLEERQQSQFGDSPQASTALEVSHPERQFQLPPDEFSRGAPECPPTPRLSHETLRTAVMANMFSNELRFEAHEGAGLSSTEIGPQHTDKATLLEFQDSQRRDARRTFAEKKDRVDELLQDAETTPTSTQKVWYRDKDGFKIPIWPASLSFMEDEPEDNANDCAEFSDEIQASRRPLFETGEPNNHDVQLIASSAEMFPESMSAKRKSDHSPRPEELRLRSDNSISPSTQPARFYVSPYHTDTAKLRRSSTPSVNCGLIKGHTTYLPVESIPQPPRPTERFRSVEAEMLDASNQMIEGTKSRKYFEERHGLARYGRAAIADVIERASEDVEGAIHLDALDQYKKWIEKTIDLEIKTNSNPSTWLKETWGPRIRDLRTGKPVEYRYRGQHPKTNCEEHGWKRRYSWMSSDDAVKVKKSNSIPVGLVKEDKNIQHGNGEVACVRSGISEQPNQMDQKEQRPGKTVLLSPQPRLQLQRQPESGPAQAQESTLEPAQEPESDLLCENCGRDRMDFQLYHSFFCEECERCLCGSHCVVCVSKLQTTVYIRRSPANFKYRKSTHDSIGSSIHGKNAIGQHRETNFRIQKHCREDIPRSKLSISWIRPAFIASMIAWSLAM